MALPLTLLSLSLSVLRAQALPSSIVASRQESAIEWGQPCVVDAGEVPIECGTLVVPLDYTNKSDPRTVNLELLRFKATQEPFKGSILTHWGGPGPSGREDFVAFAPRISAFTNGQFDMILPVQRGTQTSGNLEFKCYNNTLDPGSAAAPELKSSLSSSSQAATNWANAEIFSRDCYAAQNLTGAYLGSAFDARDWMSVVDALGEDDMLRYYGVSAGTTLGNHLVSMFPDRVDKVILDGVVNPHEYIANKEVAVFDDTDKAFSAFCSGCVDAPQNCSLGINKTAEQLETEIKDFIDGLVESPIPFTVPGIVGGSLVDLQTVKAFIYGQLYTPSTWPTMALQLEALIAGSMTGNDTLIMAAIGTPNSINVALSDTSRSEAQNGIKCGDQDHYAKREDWEVVQNGRHNNSYFADAADVVVTCARWKFEHTERYTGNFSVATKNPVMLIGNTADPITPITGARNASAGYEGSVVLEHGGYGHCSHLSQGSLCTAKAIRSYFLEGILPQPNTRCEIDVPLFSNTTGWAGVVAEMVGA